MDFHMEDMDPLGALPDNVLRNGNTRGSTGEKSGKTVPAGVLAGENIIPLHSPALLELAVANGQGGLYKGLQFDKERNIWQVRFTSFICEVLWGTGDARAMTVVMS